MKKIFKFQFFVIFLLVTTIVQSQASTIFNGIEFGESKALVQEKVKVISENIRVIKIDTPSFPLSKDKEEHLIASNVKLKNGTVKKVVFTFLDDKLSYVQASGNVVKSITLEIIGEVASYLDYRVYNSGLLYINQKSDNAWFLTPESLHLNLFTWNNPYLNTNVEKHYNPSIKIPAFLKMGEDLNVLLPHLKENSLFIQVEKLDKTTSINKIQINCFGVEYAGFPRKFEARFENNKLQKVWILTGKEEEGRIRNKMIKEYGSIIFKNNNWEVFNNWTVLLRKDKPEVLLLTKELGLKYKKQYTK